MINCAACGAENPDGAAFCGECGEYLAWEGNPTPQPVAAAPTQAAAPPAAPAPTPPPPAPAAPTAPAPSAVGPPPAGPPAGPSPAVPTRHAATTAQPGQPPAAPGPSSPPPGAPAVPGRAGPAPAVPTRRAPDQGGSPTRPVTGAEALIVPVDETAPAKPARSDGPPRPPAPVQPGQAERRAPTRDLPPEDRRPQPGEVICGNCGAGNVATRKFCRRCGADLADAPVVPPRPWWQRLLRGERKRAAPVAGTRPPRLVRRSYRGPLTFLVVLALLGAAGYQTRDLLRSGYELVLDRVMSKTLETPSRLTASSAAPGHPKGAAQDGASNTFWAPDKSGNMRGAWLQANFDQPFRLVNLIVLNGASDKQPEYRKEARPKSIRLTVARTHGTTFQKVYDLNDVAGPQRLAVGVSDVKSVRITVLTVEEPGPGRYLALAEVEYYGRK